MKYLFSFISLAVLAATLGNRDYSLALFYLVFLGIITLRIRFIGKMEKRRAVTDSSVVIGSVLLIWQLLSANLKLADPVLFPPPAAILSLFRAELGDMSRGLLSSMYLLGSAYGLALATAIPAGIAVGSSQRLRAAAEPFSKVLGAIPPIVYIPYAIALLPSFSSASIFVIWSGAFWPIFVNTVSGVVMIPDSLIDSAKMLHLKKRVFFFKTLLPGAMPSVLTGASLGLIFSFLLLTAAELIGATEGLGWYVKNFSDFADYGRVIVGILFIGFVVTLLMWLFNKLERRLLRYRRNVHD